MTRLLPTRSLALSLVVFATSVGVSSAQAQSPYGAPTRSAIDEAVIAWDAGDPQLARHLVREARREAPDDELVATAIQVELDPHVVLGLDAAGRTSAMAELQAIDAQRDTAHIVGIVSGAVGLVGVFLALSLPALIDPMCSLGCEEQNGLRFGGGLTGIGALIGAGVAIGMHVDAGGWLQRWADGLRAGSGAVALRPTSFTLRF